MVKQANIPNCLNTPNAQFMLEFIPLNLKISTGAKFLDFKFQCIYLHIWYLNMSEYPNYSNICFSQVHRTLVLLSNINVSNSDRYTGH